MKAQGTMHRHSSAFREFLKIYKYSLLRQYVFVPLGVIVFMMILYGVNKLIHDVIKIKFPASVAVMLVNFGALCVMSSINITWTEKYIGIIDIPLSWSLRWMNLFFTPAFVTLPLSPWISFREAMLITAVFVFSYLIIAAILAYITMLCQKILRVGYYQRAVIQKEGVDSRLDTDYSSDEEGPLDIYEEDDDIHDFQGIFSEAPLKDVQMVNFSSNSGFPLESTHTNRSHIRSVTTSLDDENIIGITMNSKHAILEENQMLMRETRDSDDFEVGEMSQYMNASLQPLPAAAVVASAYLPNQYSEVARHNNMEIDCERAITRQFSRRIEHLFTVNMWHDHFHHILYTLGFFATIFTYYFSWYSMPFQLFTSICMFMLVVDAPIFPKSKYRKFMHPVIFSVALFWIVILISVLIKRQEIKYFLSDLRQYKVGRSYLYLFDTKSFGKKQWPGAGDIFGSCMDVSIVGLSMPMYTYRADLRRHFLAILIPILILCAGCLTLYPIICHKIGISSYNSIGFIGRSITLALGIPTIQNFDGSVTIMAVTTVLSGILGSISGIPMLDLLRVPQGDYVTRGLTLGCNCGAIATSFLLTVDRRAAAISSLSFVLFGTLMVILSSIGSIKQFVQELASL